MDKSKHGGAGRGQGRKPTGRVRTEKLSAKFTQEEKESFIKSAKESGETQTDFILKRCVEGSDERI